MKIIIAGAGDVGFHLAKMLSSEAKDIYVIDLNEDRLQQISSQSDVFTINGDAKSIEVLEEAVVSDCDLLIAVTYSEETNLMVSILAKKFGVKRVIARINNVEIIKNSLEHHYYELGIDTLISPTHLATLEIERLIHRAVFTDDIEFENGKLTVFGISIGKNSVIANKTISESSKLNPNLSFKPIALHRDEETIMLDKNTKVKTSDILYFISSPESIDTIIQICGRESFEIKDIMILGGSRIGCYAAELLEKHYNVTLIEKDKAKCDIIAGMLKRTLVINIDGHDVKQLEEEGLADMDAFIALTGDSETNIMSSLVANNHNVKKTIARVENIDYIHLSQAIGIDTLINKKVIAASNIFKFIRKGDVSSIANLHGVDAEIIEFIVKPNSKITRVPIKELRFPKTANIAGVIRGDKTIIPFGNFQLEHGDKAIVFSLTESIHKIEKYFQ